MWGRPQDDPDLGVSTALSAGAHSHRAFAQDRRMTSRPIYVTASGDGVRTRGTLRGPGFELTSRGIRIPKGADDPFVRIRAAVAPLPPSSVVCGPSAALVLGLPIPARLVDPLKTHVLVPRGTARIRRRDLVVHLGDLADGERAIKHGIRVTSAPRTFVDLAAELGFADLVAFGDASLRLGYSLDDMATVFGRRGRYRGKAAVREALGWLDGAAESPQESRLRVALRRGGLPQPRVNAEIRDRSGRFVARCDLVFDEARLVVEYDGVDHLTRTRQRRDAERRAELQALGWMVLELNAHDLADPRRAVEKVRRALRSRGVAC